MLPNVSTSVGQNLYIVFLALATSWILLPTYFTLVEKKVAQKSIWIFLIASFVGTLLISKSLASIGFWISYGNWNWGPSSILGFHFCEIVFWRPWALKNSASRDVLFKRWSVSNPLALALGRVGCYFAGCCYAKPGIFIIWPLVEAGTLILLAIGLRRVKDKISPVLLFEIYLYFALGCRFFLEFLRGDMLRGSWETFSFPQLVCVILIVILALDSQRRKYHTSKA
jgi:hypothetical protein